MTAARAATGSSSGADGVPAQLTGRLGRVPHPTDALELCRRSRGATLPRKD